MGSDSIDSNLYGMSQILDSNWGFQCFTVKSIWHWNWNPQSSSQISRRLKMQREGAHLSELQHGEAPSSNAIRVQAISSYMVRCIYPYGEISSYMVGCISLSGWYSGLGPPDNMYMVRTSSNVAMIYLIGKVNFTSDVFLLVVIFMILPWSSPWTCHPCTNSFWEYPQ